MKRAGFVLLLFTLLNSCNLFNNNTSSTGTLVITEVGNPYWVNYSSWFEVYNPSADPVNLSDFTLRASSVQTSSPWNTKIETYTLPSLDIPGGSYAIIRGKTDAMDQINGRQIVFIVKNGYQPWWYVSGFLELIKNNQTVDFVRFGSSIEEPTTGTWNGGSEVSLPNSDSSVLATSLARDENNTDTDSDSDWSIKALFTPGGPNDVNSGADTDNDGIPDEAESPGGTWMGLPLYAWGARVGVRDIFIHIDYMNHNDPGVTPQEEALQKVRSVFSDHGIRLHIDAGDLFVSGTDTNRFNLDGRHHSVPWSAGIALGNYSGYANLYQYKSQYLPIAKRQLFHYCIFGYTQDSGGTGGSSGIAEINGNDLIVTLGDWGLSDSGTVNQNTLINWQAATLMHEFGHNLGLRHGGSSDTNYQPNYYSIMNYMYQLYGLPVVGYSTEGDRYYLNQSLLSYSSYWQLDNGPTNINMDMDYSSGNGLNLDESGLIESQGLRQPGSTAVNWNGDGDTADTVSRDVNSDGEITILLDHDDWSAINLFFNLNWSGFNSGASLTSAENRPDMITEDQQEIIIETLTRPN